MKSQRPCADIDLLAILGETRARLHASRAVVRAAIAYRDAVNDATTAEATELLQALISAVDDLEGTDSRG